MYRFLKNNRAALIARCELAVAQRPHRVATKEQLRNGIPLFIDQLTRTLEAEEESGGGLNVASAQISGPPGGDLLHSEIGVSAAAHGRQLMELGYTIDQVVHDYGDLCQAVTGLAVERDAPFTIDEFRTLNRCLDNAIADAVTEFSAQRDIAIELRHTEAITQRIGVLVHELRNAVHTASLASLALDAGSLSYSGATGGVLKRSLATMSALLTDALSTVRASAVRSASRPRISVATLVGDAAQTAALEAAERGCTMAVDPVDPALFVDAHREPLLAAIVNLLQNAAKFTRPGTTVRLSTRAADGDRVNIEVSDQCGGLPAGFTSIIFKPFTQGSKDRTGLGLGLSIARQGVEAEGGTLSVRDIPGTGCVFTISLPQAADRRDRKAP